MPSTNSLQDVFGLLLARHLEDVALERDAIVAVDDRADEIRPDHLLVQLLAAAADVGVEHLAPVALVGPQLLDGLAVHAVSLSLLVHPLRALGAELPARPRRRVVDDELVDDDAVQERRPVEEAGPVPGMLVGRLGLAVDTDLRDEPLALAVPVVDDRRSQLDVVGDDQRGHVRQDVLLEKRHVVTAVGLDRGVEPQPAVHELGDRLHHQPVHAATAGAVHPNAVLPPGHVAHRLDRPVPVRVPGDDHVIARSLVEDDADRSLPLALAVRKTQPSSGRVNVKARPGSEIESDLEQLRDEVVPLLRPRKDDRRLGGTRDAGRDRRHEDRGDDDCSHRGRSLISEPYVSLSTHTVRQH